MSGSLDGVGSRLAASGRRPQAVDPYQQTLIVAGEERAEIRYVWEQAGRAMPALADFVSRRLVELGGAGGASIVEDLHALPDVALCELTGRLRRVVAWQSGPGLAHISAVVSLLREERGRRVRSLVGQAEPSSPTSVAGEQPG